jgi:hypothetical protein
MRSIVKALLPSFRLVAGTTAIAAMAALAMAVSRPTIISVDGQRVVSDVPPVSAGDGLYLPLRAVTEAAGARTTYDAQTGDLIVRRGADTLRMRVGDRHASLNGTAIELSKAPFNVRGRAMVRGTDLAQALGSALRYDRRRDRVDVRTPGAVVAGAPDDTSF